VDEKEKKQGLDLKVVARGESLRRLLAFGVSRVNTGTVFSPVYPTTQTWTRARMLNTENENANSGPLLPAFATRRALRRPKVTHRVPTNTHSTYGPNDTVSPRATLCKRDRRAVTSSSRGGHNIRRPKLSTGAPLFRRLERIYRRVCSVE